jgi:hypothetical protein
MLNLYIQKEELPLSGTMLPSYHYEDEYFISVLQSNGYVYRSAPRMMRIGKSWWRCGPGERGIRWKDWNSATSAFDSVHFHNMYEPNPEYIGYHAGKHYGI